MQWTDINDKNGTIAINHPEKGSRTRTVKVTEKTIAMLKNLPKKNGDYVFNSNDVTAHAGFVNARKRLAQRMQNPRLRKIHFHTLRHWRAVGIRANRRHLCSERPVRSQKHLQHRQVSAWQLLKFRVRNKET